MSLNNKYRGWRFLYSPRWLGYYAMLVIFAIACVMLSNWQFDRRQQAQAEIARIVNNYDAAPVDFASAMPTDYFDIDKHKWLPVTLTGQYTGEPLIVRNRPGQGGTGSHIVQAFESQGRIIFVDRGWLDAVVNEDGTFDFSSSPLAKTGTEIALTIRLRAAEPDVSGRLATEDSVGSFNPEQMIAVSKIENTDVILSAYGMLIAESPEQDHAILSAKPALDEGPHLSYALQWLVFIVIAGTGIGYAARQEFRNFNRGSAKVQEMDRKRERRKQQRPATDADEEDAWIAEHS